MPVAKGSSYVARYIFFQLIDFAALNNDCIDFDRWYFKEKDKSQGLRVYEHMKMEIYIIVLYK